MGGDPKSDHEALKTDSGGDPRTDHASLSCEIETGGGMAATCPPYRPGRLASETANSSASAPAAMLDFSVGGVHPDEFSTMCAERPDGLPRCVDEHEAFPEGSSILDRILQRRFRI